LVAAWLRLDHVLFTVVAGVVCLVLTSLMVLWDGWCQSSPAGLTSRGIFPDSDRAGE
jgi:hypothetical protein